MSTEILFFLLPKKGIKSWVLFRIKMIIDKEEEEKKVPMFLIEKVLPFFSPSSHQKIIINLNSTFYFLQANNVSEKEKQKNSYHRRINWFF